VKDKKRRYGAKKRCELYVGIYVKADNRGNCEVRDKWGRSNIALFYKQHYRITLQPRCAIARPQPASPKDPELKPLVRGRMLSAIAIGLLPSSVPFSRLGDRERLCNFSNDANASRAAEP
jgi:hypothetical protein